MSPKLRALALELFKKLDASGLAVIALFNGTLVEVNHEEFGIVAKPYYAERFAFALRHLADEIENNRNPVQTKEKKKNGNRNRTTNRKGEGSEKIGDNNPQ